MGTHACMHVHTRDGRYQHFCTRLNKHITIITIIDLTVSVLKTVYNMSNCLKMCLNIAIKLVIRANYHDNAQLLLVMIIVSSKNYTISIIGKESITINGQGRLVAHP